MFYDLHIHSGLSPCSDDDMTVNNIVNMSFIKGLDMIAITDHNSMRQLRFLDKICEGKIDYVYGVEIQTREEIHVLGYFKKDTDLGPIQKWLDVNLIKMPNDKVYYGNEFIFDEEDNVIAEEDNLLITSIDLSISEVISKIHEFGGIAVLAHVLAQKYSVIDVFRKIPDRLDYDGLEITDESQQEEVQKMIGDRKTTFFVNSDAHRLEAISEPIHEMNRDAFFKLWRTD